MTNTELSVIDLQVAVDADGIRVLLSADRTGGYVTCGETLVDVTVDQAERIQRGDLKLLCALFDYDEFKSKR